MAKKVLKIVAHEWGAASRDRKELGICRELGCEIVGMQKGGTKDKGRHEVLHGFDVYNYSTRPLGDAKILKPLNRIISFFTWAHHARKFHADIITGHDYLALLIGWMSTVFIPKKKKPKLVYDSHEYELGRNKKRSKFALWCVKKIEGFLIKRCAFTIIECDEIADKLVEVYGCKRPIVAHNVTVKWQLDTNIIAQRRREICEKLNVGTDSFILMSHGAMMPNRGLEQTLDAAEALDLPVVLLGYINDQTFFTDLMKRAEDRGFKEKVLYLPAVPLDILWQYVGAANLGTIILQPQYESHRMTLPNKLFENIQSLTPVITSNFNGLKAIVEGGGIGLTVDPEKPDELIEAIKRMRDDKEFYARCKENLKSAKERFCWENDKQALYDAYKAIIEE